MLTAKGIAARCEPRGPGFLIVVLMTPQGASRLTAGVNTARDEAYRLMLARGFRAGFLGLAMHKPNEAGYNRSDVYLIDDWR